MDKKEILARFDEVNVRMDYVNKVLRIENSDEIFNKAVCFLKFLKF